MASMSERVGTALGMNATKTEEMVVLASEIGLPVACTIGALIIMFVVYKFGFSDHPTPAAAAEPAVEPPVEPAVVEEPSVAEEPSSSSAPPPKKRAPKSPTRAKSPARAKTPTKAAPKSSPKAAAKASSSKAAGKKSMSPPKPKPSPKSKNTKVDAALAKLAFNSPGKSLAAESSRRTRA
jgi:hypothetical protein